MKTVNPYFLHTLIGPLTGMADDDSAVRRFSALDANSEADVKAVIRELLVPHYVSLTVSVRERAKTTLGYYLDRGSIDFGRVYESNLPPFDPPTNPRDFFLWLWQELFPSESFGGAGSDDIRIVSDIDEPNRLSARN